MKQQERSKELAAAHWGYTGKLLELTGVVGCDYALCEYLYKAAAVHFYGHAVEDIRNGMFDTEGAAAAIADVKRDMGEGVRLDPDHPLASEKHKADRKASLCHSCHQEAPCTKEQIVACEDTDTCPRYVSALRESVLDAKQEAAPPMCDTCTKERVCGFKHGSVSQCELYERFEGYDKAKQEAIAAGQVGANCTTEVCRHFSRMFMRNCPQYSSSAISGCAYYRPEWEDAKQEAPTAAVLPSTHTDPSTNCKDCFNAACAGKGRNLTCDQGCERFMSKELAQ